MQIEIKYFVDESMKQKYKFAYDVNSKLQTIYMLINFDGTQSWHLVKTVKDVADASSAKVNLFTYLMPYSFNILETLKEITDPVDNNKYISKRDFKGIKSINIRDYQDNPENRRSMGLFKKYAYDNKLTQEDALTKLMRFAYQNGFIKEKDSPVKAIKFLPIDNVNQWLAEENPSFDEERLISAEEDFESDYSDQWEPVYDSNKQLLGYKEVE